MSSALIVERLGCRPYQEVWELQRRRQAELIAGQGPERLLICEHPEVLTLGRSGRREHLRCSAAELQQRGIAVIATDRGGNVTWHGPGQLLCYPIINLNRRRRDVSWYMRQLEEIVINTLTAFEIPAQRQTGLTGVFVVGPPPRKIASLGVRISRWCTMHGLALNVNNSLAGFDLICPCGLADVVMTSLSRERQERGKTVITTDQAAAVLEQICRENLLAAEEQQLCA